VLVRGRKPKAVAISLPEEEIFGENKAMSRKLREKVRVTRKKGVLITLQRQGGPLPSQCLKKKKRGEGGDAFIV